jgi:hypothetical protein
MYIYRNFTDYLLIYCIQKLLKHESALYPSQGLSSGHGPGLHAPGLGPSGHSLNHTNFNPNNTINSNVSTNFNTNNTKFTGNHVNGNSNFNNSNNLNSNLNNKNLKNNSNNSLNNLNNNSNNNLSNNLNFTMNGEKYSKTNRRTADIDSMRGFDYGQG